VGPGNVPVFIDRKADLKFAVENILLSKTFDNGVICASEQAVVVEKDIAAALAAEFERQGGYFLDKEQTQRMQKTAVDESGMMRPEVVGRSVQELAAIAGIQVPAGAKVLLARLDGVGPAYPLSNEVLAPILAFYEATSREDAMKICVDLNYLGGTGHTAVIYSENRKTIEEFSELMNAGRILVNTPAAQGAGGGVYNSLPTALTLGCGSGGKNSTTENITARHLINIKHVCRRRPDQRWFAFGPEKFLDQNLDADSVWDEYNRNY